MIKTPLSTVIGGAGIWTPGCTVIGGQQNIDQLIKSLFADGTQGIYLNAQDALSVSDLSSIKDLSGNNNHAVQADSAKRATLITDPSGYKSLKFDGIDDGYVTQSINFTATDKVTVIAAVRKLSDIGDGMVVELSPSYANVGTFGLKGHTGSSVSWHTKGSLTWNNVVVPNQQAPKNLILTSKADLSATDLTKKSSLTVNGITTVSPTTDIGAGSFGNYPLYIGRRAGTSLPFNGQIYALLVIGKLLDDATTQRIEKEFAKYIGVTL